MTFQRVSAELILHRLSFVGPAMSDAITNLGGVGLSLPWLANLANSLSYTFSCFSTIIGGPVINKIGIKWACFIAAVAMPLHGSAYYTNARYNVEWYLIAANVGLNHIPCLLLLIKLDYQRYSSRLPIRR
jgi:hypothetical protein